VSYAALCEGEPMPIDPSSDRARGPWDPDEKEKWIDTRHFWVLLPLLLLMVAMLVMASVLGP
jgi:hypothetical protein